MLLSPSRVVVTWHGLAAPLAAVFPGRQLAGGVVAAAAPFVVLPGLWLLLRRCCAVAGLSRPRWCVPLVLVASVLHSPVADDVVAASRHLGVCGCSPVVAAPGWLVSAVGVHSVLAATGS